MDDPAFQPAAETELENPETSIATQTILLHAANHDLNALKPFLRVPGAASVQDPETGFTPLHAAIASCEAGDDQGEEERNEELQKAREVVRELFLSGAIWNDLDVKGETPGCLAWRLGCKALYEECVQAGVRAEVLLGIMGGYEELSGGEDEEDDEEEMVIVEGDGTSIPAVEETQENGDLNGQQKEKRDVNSEDYLKSDLKFEDDKLLDADSNGVMMAWETDIMQRSVDLLLPSPSTGKRILNIGFGMGIIDGIFARTSPTTHHIIEAHPSVLSQLSSLEHAFGPQWESQEGKNNKVYAGRWQDICPQLLESGFIYDAIYFDTFGEDYTQLKLFFTEFLPGLLDERGRFGFFNGLGADRRICYDVYTRVLEMDLLDAGLEVEWQDVPVEGLGGEGEGTWEGVRRRYWVLDTYRLPVCEFLG